MSKSKKSLTINLSRIEVMAHEIGPIIKKNAEICNLDLSNFGHIETLYKKNPNKDGVDYIDSRFYNGEENVEFRAVFVDEGQQDLWELKETMLDRYLEDDDDD